MLVKYPDAKMAISRRRPAGRRARERIVVYFDEPGVKRYSHKLAYVAGLLGQTERHISAVMAGLAVRFKLLGAKIIACVYRVDTDSCYTLYVPLPNSVGVVFDDMVPAASVLLCRTTNKIYRKNYKGKIHFGKTFVSLTGERYIIPLSESEMNDDSIETVIKHFVVAVHYGANNQAGLPKEIASVLACVRRKNHYYIFAQVRTPGDDLHQMNIPITGLVK